MGKQRRMKAMMVRSYLTVSVMMVMMVESQPVGHHQPSSLSHSVSRLSANLLRSIDETESPFKNVIISPVSIFLALSLLYHGLAWRLCREQGEAEHHHPPGQHYPC